MSPSAAVIELGTRGHKTRTRARLSVYPLLNGDAFVYGATINLGVAVWCSLVCEASIPGACTVWDVREG